MVRADEIFDPVRTGTEREAKVPAFENAEPELITNLQHRVVQKRDKNAEVLLKEVHQIEA